MTGPEHFREAERQLQHAVNLPPDDTQPIALVAIGHALLALTAASLPNAGAFTQEWVKAMEEDRS